MAETVDTTLVGRVVRHLEEAKSHHDYFVALYERRERAYRGVKNKMLRPKWKHDLHPPYAFNLLETVVASQIEMGLRFDVRPSPMSELSPDEAGHMLTVSEDVEDLLRHEHRVDLMDRTQRPLFLCDGIGGVAVGKSYWNYVEGVTKRQGVQETIIHGPNGEELGSVPTVVEIAEKGILRDHSTTEILDPRDFIWHESAQHLDPYKPGGAQHVMHRCWYSYEQLLQLEQLGIISNVAELKNAQNNQQNEYNDRSSEVFNINRQKDLLEVIEYWWFEGGQIFSCWVGGRTVLLKAKTPNPFWHGQYPFFISSSMPQPFSLRGTSTIELIEELQSILWELQNQRLDNVELINNAIMLIRSDVDDPDAFEFYPGARWEVDDPQAVQALAPPYQLASVSLEAESLLKGDLQNVTAAAPLAGGQTAGLDQKTATGASLVMNAAQQQLAQKKYQAQFGLQDEANMRIKNCQQFYDGNKLVHILGAEGAVTFKDIPIIAIQGEFLVELKPMSESTMRQERRAEATNFAQLMIGFAPIAAAAGKPLDIEAIIKWFAKNWDIEYPEQFFAVQAAALGAAGMGPGGPTAPPGAAPPGGAPNMGTTAATAVDASKPSATGGLSMSPQMFAQRAAALAGGARGGGRQ